MSDANTTIKEHIGIFKNNNKLMPSIEAVMTNEIRNILEEVYRCDYDMIDRIETAVRRL